MKNILLVDDNKHVLEALSLTLGIYARGYTILKAKNGREASDTLDRTPVDLVLTDLEMPVMDGYKLIEYISTTYPSMPLLVMTSDTSPEVIKKLSSLGITHCMEKPFDYEKVTHLIMRKLTSRSQPELKDTEQYPAVAGEQPRPEKSGQAAG